MCSVVGALLRSANAAQAKEINAILKTIWLSSHARGRDGRGAGWARGRSVGAWLHDRRARRLAGRQRRLLRGAAARRQRPRRRRQAGEVAWAGGWLKGIIRLAGRFYRAKAELSRGQMVINCNGTCAQN